MQSMKLGIDVNRHKEIIVKAVSAILLLLLKHFKVFEIFRETNFIKYFVKSMQFHKNDFTKKYIFFRFFVKSISRKNSFLDFTCTFF